MTSPVTSEDAAASLPPLASTPGELTLSEERATVTSEWIPTSRLTIERRIVTEVQTLEVEVRREELIITERALPGDQVAAALPPGQEPAPLSERRYVLHAEVPSVRLEVLPIEEVTVTTKVTAGSQDVAVSLRSERLAGEEDV